MKIMYSSEWREQFRCMFIGGGCGCLVGECPLFEFVSSDKGYCKVETALSLYIQGKKGANDEFESGTCERKNNSNTEES